MELNVEKTVTKDKREKKQFIKKTELEKVNKIVNI